MADLLDMAVYQGVEWSDLDRDLTELFGYQQSSPQPSVYTAPDPIARAGHSVQMLLDAHRSMLRTVARSGIEHREFWLITTAQANSQARLRTAHIDEISQLRSDKLPAGQLSTIRNRQLNEVDILSKQHRLVRGAALPATVLCPDSAGRRGTARPPTQRR